MKAAAALTLILLQAGPLAARAAEREEPHYCDGAPTMELRKAAVSSTAVFLEFASGSPDRQTAGRRVMRIPLDDPRWPQGQPANREAACIPSGSVAAPSDARVREVSDWLLPPGSRFPLDADPLPIVGVGGVDRLSRGAGGAPRGIQVLSLGRIVQHGGDDAAAGTISPKSLALADPVFAVARRREDGSTATLIVADVHEGCEREKGWYALAPLAVTGEASLIAPLAGHLLLSGLWAE